MTKPNKSATANHIRDVRQTVDDAVAKLIKGAVADRPAGADKADSVMNVAFALLCAAASILHTVEERRPLTNEEVMDLAEKALTVWGMV